MPLNDSSVSSSLAARRRKRATASRAIACSRFGPDVVAERPPRLVTSASSAAASASSVGYFASHSWYFGSTRSTCVCCSITSETRMWYGSGVAPRQRASVDAYHPSSRAETAPFGGRGQCRRRAPPGDGNGSGGMRASQENGPGIIGVVTLYTRTGDAGETSLFDGTRVSKADARVDAYGHVDELNAVLGQARGAGLDATIDGWLDRIQQDLFAVGAQLADPVPASRPA